MISDVDETGVTVAPQSQTFKEARFCVRTKVEAKNVEDAEADPMRVRLRSAGSDFGSQLGQWDVDTGMDVDREDGHSRQ